jgi:hypothetical protein
MNKIKRIDVKETGRKTKYEYKIEVSGIDVAGGGH